MNILFSSQISKLIRTGPRVARDTGRSAPPGRSIFRDIITPFRFVVVAAFAEIRERSRTNEATGYFGFDVITVHREPFRLWQVLGFN